METSIMQASLSTVMMAVLTTNVFLILIVLCLANEKLLIRVGHRLLALFIVFTTLRFVLPIELPFTIPVKLPVWVSDVIAFCRNRLFLLDEQPISLWQIFKAVWLIGFVVGLLIHIISYYRSSRLITLYGKELTHTEPYRKLLTEICKTHGRTNRFRVIELPGLDVPALFGLIHPRILIPENFTLPEQQLGCILQHEAAHHFHHDLVLKILVKIITLAYWWDIFSWLLNRQADLILEMRNDDSLTMADSTMTEEYMQCLIEVSERAANKKLLPNSLTLGILPSGYKDLKRRFRLMTNNQNKPQTGLTVLLILISTSIYVFSYSIILEGYSTPKTFIPQTLSSDEYEISSYYFPSSGNSYFIDNGNGTYNYYMGGTYIETVDSLEYYPDDIPVYTKDTAPQ